LSAGTTDEVLEKLQKTANQPDVMVLDIRLKEKLNGIGLAKQLQREKIPCIFLTAFPEENQFVQASRVHPSAYFIKPVKPLELHHAIQLAVLNEELEEEHIEPVEENEPLLKLTLKDKDNLPRRVPVAKIFAVESFGNYLLFHTHKGRFHKKGTLKNMENRLRHANFIRIHRQFLIAADHWEKKLPLGEELGVAGSKFPIGRTFRKKILAFLERHIG
jgi:DNA-binding LytR/AlgR family response regulator